MCTVAQGVVAQTAFAQGVVAVARIAVADFLLLLILCLQVPQIPNTVPGLQTTWYVGGFSQVLSLWKASRMPRVVKLTTVRKHNKRYRRVKGVMKWVTRSRLNDATDGKVA